MHQYLKRGIALFPAILLFVLSFYPNQTQASHLQGCQLTYECIGPCSIRVYWRCYRDCSGVPGITPTSFQFTALTGGCQLPSPTTNWSQQVVTEVTPICPSTPTKCTTPGAQIDGVQEYFQWRDYNTCASPNCQYQMSWSSCCRNPDITSLINPGGTGMYIGATTLNTGIQPCNSSPQFSNPPVPYICAGQPYTFNQGAVDPDGDSLSYSLGPCYASANNLVNYAPGYSATAPLGPSWGVVINPLTGDITVSPSPGNIVVGVMCVYVEEWRNGVLINTIVRDMQMQVIPCPNNNLPQCVGITNPSNGTINGPFEITVCAGENLTFQLPFTDPDQGQTQKLFWNQNLASLGASFFNGAQVDTINGQNPVGIFSWTPQTTGTYTFLATCQDDACPILGQNQYTVVINVNGGLVNPILTAAPTGCTNVSLNVNPGLGNTGPYQYQWFGDGNLNQNPANTTAAFSHTYPGPGSYAVNVQVTDAFGCVTVLTDTVIIANGPTADAGPDISLCSGYSIQLGAPTIGGQSYTWFPATGISNPSISDPFFQHTVIGATPDTFDITLSATSGFCTAVDLLTIVVYPTPVATIAGNINICNGQQTTLTASGGTSYLWSTGATTPSITVNPTQTTTYTVTAIDNGCASQPVPVTVTVSNGPTAIITGVDSVCAGDNVTLTVAGGTSWQWNTGATTQTITIPNVQQNTTVTVVASDNGCQGPQATFTIVVHEKPVAAFANTTECVGATTTFSDASTISQGGLIGWQWNFGDPGTGTNNTSATQSPTHTFSGAGQYSVQLIVTAYNGCMDTIQQNITVNALPPADFSFLDVCEGETMAFNDQSGAGVTGWLWDFGNGQTSNIPNPSHNFNSVVGPHNVTLTVFDGNGCSNSMTRTVFVHPNPVADFTWEHKCWNSITEFTSTSFLTDPLGTTLDSHSWNFGDPGSGANNTSNEPNPVHNFPGPGLYNVTLTVMTSQTCTNTITIPVNVPAVSPLVPHGDTICMGHSGRISVSNIPPGSQVEWFYTPTGTTPFLTGQSWMDTPPLQVTTAYYAAVRDADGCLSPKTGVRVVVHPDPIIDISVNENTFQLPNAIAEFTVDFIRNGPVIAWMWDFGDGTTSGEQNPVHEYTEEGIYTVTLTTINEFGCETTQTWTNYIEVTKSIGIYIPNAFTPNGDGLNDEFNVVTKLITDFNIQIFDRWGKLLFQSDDMNFRWDGTFAGEKLPEGVYTYVVNATEWSGEPVEKVGTIQLIR